MPLLITTITELQEEDPIFNFTGDYFSDNIADKDALSRDSAKYWKKREKLATAAKKAIKKRNNERHGRETTS